MLENTLNKEVILTTIKLMIMIYVMNTMHTLTSLIMIEFMAISAACTSCMILMKLSTEMHMTLFLTIILITESIVGLSVLIKMIRTHSNDLIKSTSLSL